MSDLEIPMHLANLCLQPGASKDEVILAARRLSKQFHTDFNTGPMAAERFRQVREAHQFFKANDYNTFVARTGPFIHNEAGYAPFTSAPPYPRHGHNGHPHNESKTQPHDDYEADASFTRATPPRPKDIKRRIKVSLEEAAAGFVRKFTGTVTDPCQVCKGTGEIGEGRVAMCEGCYGKGFKLHRQSGRDVKCSECDGAGYVTHPCTACNSTGLGEKRTYSCTVRFPPGIRDGQVMVADGFGKKAGGVVSDLAVTIQIAKHPIFRVHPDLTVECAVSVDGFKWLAGAEIQVPMLDGPGLLTLIPDERFYRLKGKGFPTPAGGERGVLQIEVRPRFPTNMTPQMSALVQQLAALSAAPGAEVHPKVSQWLTMFDQWASSLEV